MSSTAAFLASFTSILIGAAIGMGLKRLLPAGVLDGGSKEAVRLGAGFLSTLSALVIGLMIASAKNSYDTQNTCLLYTSPSARDGLLSRMPSSA